MSNDVFNWYESALSSRERKTRGHYSTPPALVERILDACGYTADIDLSHLRILDPACGSGNFLAGAARRLILSEKRRGIDNKRLLLSVPRNLWGLDPDPIACFLAETQLRTVFSEQGIDSGKQLFHIHQADGLVFPWGQGESVDLFLANPPYLAAKNNDLSGYRSLQEGGQADSYLLFLRLALQIVRPQGWIGLVLPDPVLARANAAKERQRLLEETTVHYLWHLSGVFHAYVGAVVIVAQKCPPQRVHQVRWVREKWGVDKRHGRPQGCSASDTGWESGRLQESIPGVRGWESGPQGSSTNGVEWESGRLQESVSDVRGWESGRLQGSLPSDAGWESGRLQGSLPSDAGWESGRPQGSLPSDIGWESGRPQGSSPLTTPAPAPTMIRDGDDAEGIASGVLASSWSYGQQVSQVLLRSQPGAELRYLLGEARQTLVERLHAYLCSNPVDELDGFAPLSSFVSIRRGEELGKENLLLAKTLPTDMRGWYPVLRGGVDVRAYEMPNGNHWIAGEAVIKPLERYLAPKLLVVKSTGSLHATLDLRGHVVLQTLYLLNIRKPESEEELDLLYFLLALLNSHVLRQYVYVLYTAYKWVQPQMEQHVLAGLPIPLVDVDKRRGIVERAKSMTLACSRVSSVVELEEQMRDEELERAICRLYEDAMWGC